VCRISSSVFLHSKKNRGFGKLVKISKTYILYFAFDSELLEGEYETNENTKD
jgi:hypothetical protein